MKKALILLISLSALILLFSCSISNGGDSEPSGDAGDSGTTPPSGDSSIPDGDTLPPADNSGNGSTPPDTDGSEDIAVTGTTVFSREQQCDIVIDEIYDGTASLLESKIFNATGFHSEIKTSKSPSDGAEIVIGSTDRKISALAYSRLNRTCVSDTFSASYCIYVKGGSLAIAYDNGVALEYAVADLIGRIDDGALILDEGVIAIETVDLQEVARESREALREADYLNVEEKLGSEITDALRAFYRFYDEDMYIWLANLWDPVTGGFYYSASARNSPGFLPDIESTAQAMSFLTNSGMLVDYKGDYSKALPEYMKASMLDFALYLQDPEDGYFYHPQWGKTVITSRRARDLSWATSIITHLGSSPLYDTPNGIKGVYREPPDAPVAYRLRSDTKGAVSRVSATSASRIPSYFRTPDAIEKYILSLEFGKNSYAAGNTLATQRQSIAIADQKVIDRMFEVLESLQNKSNGFWEEETSFNASNGFMMVSSIYEHFKRPIPNAKKAFDSLIEIMKEKDGAVHICSVYNPWASVGRIITNIESCGTLTEATELRERLLSEAAELINITAEKLVPNFRSDGGFSYYHGYSSSRSQQALVAMPDSDESDMNSTSISITMLQCMFEALGVNTVTIFSADDFRNFIALINDMGEIIKDELKPAEPVTFDDGEVGENIINQARGNKDLTSFSIVPDPAPEKGNDTDNALRIEVTKGSSTSSLTDVPLFNLSGGTYCYVLSTDIYYESTTASSEMITQIFFAGTKNIFSLQLNAYSEKGEQKIKIYEHGPSGTYDTVATGIPFGEWFNLKVKFFSDTGRSHVFINGEFVCETDVMWEDNSKIQIDRASLLHYRNVNQVTYIDNVLFERTTEDYVKYVKPPTVAASFDGGEIPVELSNMVYSECEEYISYDIIDDPAPSGGGDKALQVDVIKGARTSGKTIFAISNVAENDNCYALTADLYYDSADTSGNMLTQIFFGGSKNLFSLQIDAYTDGGVKKLKISELDASGVGAVLVRGLEFGRWYKLRVEFYENEKLAQLYIDGEKLAETDLWWSENEDYGIASCIFLHYRNVTQRLAIDNLLFEKIEKTYEKYVKPAEPLKGHADFDGGTISEDILNTVRDGCADYISFEVLDDPIGEGEGDKAMSVNVTSGGAKASYTTLELFNSPEGADSYILSTDLLVESFVTNKGKSAGTVAEIYFGGSVKPVAVLLLQAYVDTADSTQKLKLVERTLNASGTKVDKEIVSGISLSEWVNLKLEFTEGDSTASLCIDGGEAISVSLYTAENASSEILTALIQYNRNSTERLYFDNVMFEKAVSPEE